MYFGYPAFRLDGSKPRFIGYLTSATEREGRTSRKSYTITEKGREGLEVARARLKELKGETNP